MVVQHRERVHIAPAPTYVSALRLTMDGVLSDGMTEGLKAIRQQDLDSVLREIRRHRRRDIPRDGLDKFDLLERCRI